MRTGLVVLLACLGSAAAAEATQPTTLAAVVRAGQVFITFQEAQVGVTFHVWRHSAQITTTSGATQIATLPVGSGQYLYTSTGLVIADAGTPLASGTGFMVWTTASSGAFFYAVTTSDDSSITVGTNSLTNAVSETTTVTPGWVLLEAPTQPAGAGTNWYYKYMAWEDYATWRHGVWDYYGHKVTLSVPHTIGSNNALTVFFHAAGNSGYFAPPQMTNDILSGEVVLAATDFTFLFVADVYAPSTPNHRWTNFYGPQKADATISARTEQRILRYVRLAQADATFQIDAQRVYAKGASYGGAAMHIAYHHPTVFAAAAASIGWVNIQGFGELQIPGYSGQVTEENGQLWQNWLDQDWVVQNAPPDGPPLIYTFAKDDTTVSPLPYPNLLTHTETAKLAYVAEWRNVGHNTFYLTGNASYLRFLMNESYPAFANASNSDAVGATTGKRNVNLDWQSARRNLSLSAITDTSTEYGVSLQSLVGDATADVTIRNAQAFVPSVGLTVRWENRTPGGSLIANGATHVGSDGLVTVTGLSIPAAGQRLTLTAVAPTIRVTLRPEQ